jgi:hypothetical protein
MPPALIVRLSLLTNSNRAARSSAIPRTWQAAKASANVPPR